ncbi:putative polysaccharide biosynthesis protein [Metabacillus halosaccharovorans]|uniref:putative polysaccharide biosynthesis protein n=1 Tax=Metabacillus halosaccharovorans TaxID=930124 RepID=UPI00203A92F1|nr:polysaccharide biosynthesis protein [Metabacillus halosaccharovorans]MCM3442710.1 polysaccharide biosynthesis protein [Metabacillus halosaccharovorans]
MSNKLLRGTFVLTLGTYISRILGMIYLIPFAAMVGTNGGGLFQTGYAQYTIFLSIATAGFPAAVSKFVSKYNAVGDYETSRRMFKAGIFVMLATGFIAFAILYMLAPQFAIMSLAENELNGITVEDATLVIRMVSIALIVVPLMSLIRGFFQGHQSMGPTAVSQVVEQLVRIVFLLVSTYLIMNVLNGGLVLAVGYATFAAFVGAIGGLIVLFIYWIRRKHTLLAMKENVVETVSMPLGKMFREVFRYAGPFVFVGLAIPIYNYIDTVTFNRAMLHVGNDQSYTMDMYSVLLLYVPKLVMIPVSLATAFGLTLIPTITESFTNNNRTLLHKQIDQTLQLIMLLVLPAVVGLSILAGPAYNVFYAGTSEEIGKQILMWYAPVALLFSLFTVNAAILQGLNKQKLAVISLVIGIIVKLALNTTLIELYEGVGSILATAAGYLVSLIYGFAMIKRHSGYSFRLLVKRTVLISMLCMFMGLAVSVIQSILGIFINYADGRTNAVLVTCVSVAIGGAIYIYLAYRSHLLEKIMGNRLNRFLPKRRKHEN